VYRAIDSTGALVDVLFSEHRDMKAARAFFRSAKAVTGTTPDRVTTDGHDSYPRAIRTELGKAVRHRTNRSLNNRLEQDHRGLKGRYWPMLGSNAPNQRRGSVELTTSCATTFAPAPAATNTSPPSAADCSSSSGPRWGSASWKRPDRPCSRFENTGYTCWREF
jgi:transposase-like protein